LCDRADTTPHDLPHFNDDCTHVRPFAEASLAQLATAAGFFRIRPHTCPVRGIRHIVQAAGERWATAHMRFADTYLGSLRVVNMINLMFEAWK